MGGNSRSGSKTSAALSHKFRVFRPVARRSRVGFMLTLLLGTMALSVPPAAAELDLSPTTTFPKGLRRPDRGRIAAAWSSPLTEKRK